MAASLPSQMRACSIAKQGGLENIAVDSVEVPSVGPTDVLIKVGYAGVNMIDTYHRGGVYKLETPFTLGTEASGTVAALGSNVMDLSVGDRVASYGLGAFAEYCKAARAKVVKLPEGLGDKEGAAALLQGLTAWTLLKEAYPVKKGDWVLVHAAAGGVGLLLCQMASYLGAHVIGTTSSEEKAKIAKENGAEHVLQYGEGFVDKVLELTGGEGCAGIYDGVGKDTWEDDFKIIARKGTICTFGNASGPVEPFPALKLAAKNVKVCRPTLGNYVYTQQEFEGYSAELFKLIADGKLNLRVHGEYPFSAEGIRKSQEDITSRKTMGKLVIKVGQD